MMACRVFRNTLFGKFRESEISTSIISRELKAAVIPLPLWQEDSVSRSKHTGDGSFDDDGASAPKVEPQDGAVP